jgi:hypothetical protein
MSGRVAFGVMDFPIHSNVKTTWLKRLVFNGYLTSM